MNNKKSAGALFFSMFLRAVVVILALVIVAMSVFFARGYLKNRANKDITNVDESLLVDDQEDELLTATPNESATEASDIQDDGGSEVKSSKGLSIAVLNATEVGGLAGKWADKLKADGYTNVQAANYYAKSDITVICVEEEGQGEDLKAYFPNSYIQVQRLDSGATDAAIDGTNIFIVIGATDTEVR
ncbi:MAG: LytR C-terminal domain-containing protein [Eubacterium sp.]|nr:LytR C-terminal domain-containing protein [Eubacterium sp.]